MNLFRMTALFVSSFVFALSCSDGSKKAENDQTMVPDTAVTDEVVTDEAVTDTAQPDETLIDEAQNDEAMSDDVATDEAITDEVVTDETITDDGQPDTELPDEDIPALSLTGTWAMLNFTTSNVTTTIPVLGEQHSVSTTAAYALATVTDTGDGTANVTAITCDITIDSGSDLVEIIIGDNYIAHLKPTDWVFMIGAGRLPNEVSAEGVLTLNGVKDLVDPYADPLPTDKNDPRVYDQDEDGHPGMTVDCIGHIPMVFNGPGTMYTIQRTIVGMFGEIQNDDTVAGSLVWESEQVVLEASNSALTSEKTIEPDLANSWFKMVRIPENWTCAEIKANEETLFPQ